MSRLRIGVCGWARDSAAQLPWNASQASRHGSSAVAMNASPKRRRTASITIGSILGLGSQSCQQGAAAKKFLRSHIARLQPTIDHLFNRFDIETLAAPGSEDQLGAITLANVAEILFAGDRVPNEVRAGDHGAAGRRAEIQADELNTHSKLPRKATRREGVALCALAALREIMFSHGFFFRHNLRLAVSESSRPAADRRNGGERSRTTRR